MLPIALQPNVNSYRTLYLKEHLLQMKYFKMPSSRWTTDLHPKWKPPGLQGQVSEEKFITKYEKSLTPSTTHWIKATWFCIKIFQASFHKAIFHIFQWFTLGKWKMYAQNQIKLLHQNHPYLDIHPKIDWTYYNLFAETMLVRLTCGT